MSKTLKHTPLKSYSIISGNKDPNGTCCLEDGRRVYSKKSFCSSCVNSYFQENQYPDVGGHPCYGYYGDTTETGLCLYSNLTNRNYRNQPIDNSFSCSSVNVGNVSSTGKTNFCNFETIFNNKDIQYQDKYEFRFITLPDWSVCGNQIGSSVPMNFLEKDFAKDSIQKKNVFVYNTLETMSPLKKLKQKNEGEIIDIDENYAFQIVRSVDNKSRKTATIRIRKLGE